MPDAIHVIRFASAIMLVSSLLGSLSGCILTSTATTRDVGPRITASSLSEITLEKTSEEWLVAAFGAPTKRSRVETEGVDILRYDVDERHTEGYYVFLLIAHASNTIHRRSWWFEIKNGVVVRYWHADPCCEQPETAPATAPAAPR